MSISLCRYSGGKSKLARSIIERITRSRVDAYREPFFGAGSIGLNLMTTNITSSTWINDRDPSVFCLWWSVAHHPEMLKIAVRAFVPSALEFRRIKAQFLNGNIIPSSPAEIVRVAIDKIGIQQMSYSGLGPMAGGPLGGWSQVNGGIDSRWNAEKICRKIDLLSPYLRRARITNLDFSVLLAEGTRALIYLDPPYFGVGDVPPAVSGTPD
jgi:site-specific DNA-adenine methylase